MSNAETRYAPRFTHPQVLVQGRAQRVECAVYRNGSQVAVTSGTYSLYSPDDTATLDAVAVSLSGSTAYYDILAATLPDTTDLGAGWQERWTLLMADSVTHTFTRDAYLGLRQAYPPVSDVDLLDLYPDLGEELLDGVTHMQRFGDAAWAEIVRWAFSRGIWPHRNIASSAFFDMLLQAWLRNVFAYMVRRTNDERFVLLWQDHRDGYVAARSQLTLKLDQDDDGFADEEHRRGVTPVVHPNVPPANRLWRSTLW